MALAKVTKTMPTLSLRAMWLASAAVVSVLALDLPSHLTDTVGRGVSDVGRGFSPGIVFSPNLSAQARQPAVRGALPGGPVFAPDRPKPPAGSVLDIESLVVVPSDDFRMERRNNFYKKDGSDGLYRWAASGHWSNYDESKTGDWQKSVPDPLKTNDGRVVRDAETWRRVRRPEVVALVETQVYGKVPANVPKVVWTAGEPTTGTTNGIATVTRTVTGRFVNADGSAFVEPSPPAQAPGGPAHITTPEETDKFLAMARKHFGK